jgi:cytochrome P450
MGIPETDNHRPHAAFPRWTHLPRQLAGRSPFEGSLQPARVPLFKRGRPALPFPHPWNYHEPLSILETFFVDADRDHGFARHNRFLEVPGFAPVLVTRDPRMIQEISSETGDKPGQFDRDTLPSTGIARATGADTLLYANGPSWKRQKKLATPPFARTTLFQPEQFHEFERTFRRTVAGRLDVVRQRLVARGAESIRVQLEPEIKALMLEMLVNNFFGAEVPYDQIRNRFVPSLDRVIAHIVRDTVVNKLGVPLERLPSLTRGIADAKRALAEFEELTSIVLAGRRQGRGLWRQFESEAPDDALRANLRVFLAGALEATTSYASWAISHLARHPVAQELVHAEVRGIEDYTPANLAQCVQLGYALNETLRLTPALYFHPRRATANTWVTLSPDERIMIPVGTHILLDVWHANRHDDHWGVAATGYPADIFEPDRWARLAAAGKGSNDMLHFGFGHGPRFCPGKSLGQLEVALVVGACVKLFHFSAPTPRNDARAGVSTKPFDGVTVDLRLRDGVAPTSPIHQPPAAQASKCPFATLFGDTPPKPGT